MTNEGTVMISLTEDQAMVVLRALGDGNSRVFDKSKDIAEDIDGAHETYMRNLVGDKILKEMGTMVHFTELTTATEQ